LGKLAESTPHRWQIAEDEAASLKGSQPESAAQAAG